MLFPPELPPPSVMECTSPPLDQCPSHSIECTSHPIECSSHPLLGDWDEDDYDSSSEDEEVSLDEEVEHGKHQPAPIGMLHLRSALSRPLSVPFALALPQCLAFLDCLSLLSLAFSFCHSPLPLCMAFRPQKMCVSV